MRLFIFLFWLPCLAFSQCDSLAIKELFLKSNKLYADTPSYKVDTAYEVYKNDINPVMGIAGVLLKNEEYVYSKMDATERIQENNKELTISHSEQLVSYKEGVALKVNTAIDIEKLLPYMETYVVDTLDVGGFECVLIPSFTSGLPFEEVLITFRADYSIESQEMLSYKRRNIKDSLGKRQVVVEKNRMVFCFSELQNLDTKESLPKIGNFISKHKSIVTLKSSLKNYQIIDL